MTRLNTKESIAAFAERESLVMYYTDNEKKQLPIYIKHWEMSLHRSQYCNDVHACACMYVRVCVYIRVYDQQWKCIVGFSKNQQPLPPSLLLGYYIMANFNKERNMKMEKSTT